MLLFTPKIDCLDISLIIRLHLVITGRDFFIPWVSFIRRMIQSLCRYLLPCYVEGCPSFLQYRPARRAAQILRLTDCTPTSQIRLHYCTDTTALLVHILLLHSSCAPPLQLQGRTFRVGAVRQPVHISCLCAFRGRQRPLIRKLES